MGAERRVDPRADVNLEVRYRSKHDFVAAYAKNISGGGIFIHTAKPLALNQEVRLRFTLPGVAKPFEVQGLVVWANPYVSQAAFPTGMGIKFMDLDPEQKAIIDEFVQVKLAESRQATGAPAAVSSAAGGQTEGGIDLDA